MGKMAHVLIPPPGTPHLPPEEAVRRLRGAFKVVEADAEKGREHAASMIQQRLRRGDAGAAVERLRAVQAEAVQVTLSDVPQSPEEYLRFAVVPGEPIVVGYYDGRHERAARPLLKRCAEALGYRIGSA